MHKSWNPIRQHAHACQKRCRMMRDSSGFPISRIGESCTTRSRMLGLHFFMPAHLVPAVEVVRSEYSDEAVAQTVSAIMRSVRKKPVRVKRDVTGFLAKRIQHAMMSEAIALVDEGFSSAEDVDIARRQHRSTLSCTRIPKPARGCKISSRTAIMA
jgi:3-hydroxybutyryl-CoA dehydrogenase